eukprot:6122914-Pleurochrysis_carterae.AAC.1
MRHGLRAGERGMSPKQSLVQKILDQRLMSKVSLTGSKQGHAESLAHRFLLTTFTQSLAQSVQTSRDALEELVHRERKTRTADQQYEAAAKCDLEKASEARTKGRHATKRELEGAARLAIYIA